MERRNWVGERMGRGTWVDIGRAGMTARRLGKRMEVSRGHLWNNPGTWDGEGFWEDMSLTLAETTNSREI